MRRTKLVRLESAHPQRFQSALPRINMLENLFSRRKGYTPPQVQAELETLSPSARTKLWNIFYEEVFQPNFAKTGYGPGVVTKPLTEVFKIIWTEIFRRSSDEYPGFDQMMNSLKDRFLRGDWHFPFDILELVFRAKEYLLADSRPVAARIKDALETENTAYTFLKNRFVERMTPPEVESIETALQTPIDGVRVHLTSALQKLSDRENPDFRNSIKESISAVEAACRNLTKRENAILPEALKLLDGQRAFHPAFKEALVKLYGWTSDEGGIRHSIKDADKVEREDAQFMLVTCSAFVNYLFTR